MWKGTKTMAIASIRRSVLNLCIAARSKAGSFGTRTYKQIWKQKMRYDAMVRSTNRYYFLNNLLMVKCLCCFFQNECSWLARSQETIEHNLLSVATEEWFVWTGKVESLYLHVLCNQCWGLSDCK